MTRKYWHANGRWRESPREKRKKAEVQSQRGGAKPQRCRASKWEEHLGELRRSRSVPTTATLSGGLPWWWCGCVGKGEEGRAEEGRRLTICKEARNESCAFGGQ